MRRVRNTTPPFPVRAGPARERRSRESVGRAARCTAVYAVAERQAAADARVLRDNARPGARLGARGANWRTRFSGGEAEPSARSGNGAGGSGAVRLVMGFRRGPR